MRRPLNRFRSDTAGSTAVEYALIAALIVVTLITVMGPLSTALFSVYGRVASAMPQP